jgi:hypothetical protein
VDSLAVPCGHTHQLYERALTEMKNLMGTTDQSGELPSPLSLALLHPVTRGTSRSLQTFNSPTHTVRADTHPVKPTHGQRALWGEGAGLREAFHATALHGACAGRSLQACVQSLARMPTVAVSNVSICIATWPSTRVCWHVTNINPHAEAGSRTGRCAADVVVPTGFVLLARWASSVRSNCRALAHITSIASSSLQCASVDRFR